MELFKQQQYNPQAVELQVAILWAMQKGYYDAIPVDRVKDFQKQLTDFLNTRKQAVLASILKKGAVDAEIEKELTTAVDEFKVIFR